MDGGKGSEYVLVDRLNEEWSIVAADGRETARRWAGLAPALAGTHSLVDVLHRLWADPDPVLTLLLREGRSGCRVALRVALQAMLGKLVTMARCDASAGVDDYVAVFWCVASAYPLEARPRRIAANLALDTLKSVQRERRWLTRGEVTPWPPDEHLDEIVTASAAHDRLDHTVAFTADRVIEVAGTLGLLSAELQRTLRVVYCDGLSGREAAARLGLSPSQVRQRCSRGSRQLSRHATALAREEAA